MSRLLRRCAIFFALFALVPSAASAAIPPSERDALLRLFDATNGSGWIDKTRWGDAAGSECAWFGIFCDENQTTVTDIHIPNNRLTGFLPPQITQLSNLRNLDLGGNEIGGSIPAQLGQLQKLELLVLSANRLTGGIPAELGNLSSLRMLGLGEMSLGGSIPPQLGNLLNLEDLFLEYAELTGRIPPDLGRLARIKVLALAHNQLDGEIPPQLGDLASVENLFLHDNKLSGTIPRDLSRLIKLKTLYLSGNQLTGPIPSELGDLAALEELVLDTNRLSGEIPSSLARLSMLRWLHLHYNELTGAIPAALSSLTRLEELLLGFNKLSGEIPPQLGQLSNLRALDLYVNQLAGPIPTELSALSNLEQLNLFTNRLTGIVPPQLSRLVNLRTLDLGDNQLEGTIPRELGQLSRLETLALAYNRLVGPIPDELGLLSNLQDLFLNVNQLEGQIPLSLTNLSRLRTLYLYSNRLSGPIPQEFQRITSLQNLLLGDNQLSGTIPPGLMNLTNLTYLDLSGNFLEGPIPVEIGQLTRLEYLQLHSNRLSGPIPTGFGQLTNLIDARLNNNSLSGPLPPLGQLDLVEVLLLSNNELGGTLPADIGELSSVQLLGLSSNRFEGQIPREIGRLRTLVELELGANALRGPIPIEITNLTSLADGQSDFGYNALFTTNPSIRDFLNRKQEGRDWEGTQTSTPANFRVSGRTATTVVLSWERIRHIYDQGGYQVTVFATPSGTPVKVQTTPDKTYSAIVVDELSPQTTYQFVVQAVSYPNDFQKNLLVSDPSPRVSATTEADILSNPQIVVTTFPFGMVQSEGEGEDRPQDGYVLSNVGDLPTTLTLRQEGSFFTQEPTTITLGAGEEGYISLTAVPQPPGAYVGASIPQGIGVPSDLRIPVHLLSVVTPTGSVIAEAETNRLDFAAPEEVQLINGAATFSNEGNAPLHGVLVADVGWIIPQKEEVLIPAGQRLAATFQIDRSLREDEEGTATGTLSLLYLQVSSTSGAQLKRALNGSGSVSKSIVTVVDTVKPPVSSSGIPPLGAGEVALLIPGVGHLVGGGGFRFLSDISIANAFSVDALRDLRMFFTPEVPTIQSSTATVGELAPNTGLSLGDIVKSVFNSEGQAGTLQLRTQGWDKIAVSANIFNVSNPSGTYGAVIPVFRSDRALGPGERLFLTGLRKGPTTRTNLFLQEAAGQPASVQIEFLDPTGAPLGALNDSLEPYRLRRLFDRVPPGAVTARVTNLPASPGRVLAYATPLDTASGDFWSLADWNLQFAAKRSEPVLIPIAGTLRGANDTFFRTDVDIANVGNTSAAGTLRYYPQVGQPSEKILTLGAGQTRTLLDVVGNFFGFSGSSGYLVFTPKGGSFSVTSRTYATVGSSPASFGTGVPTIPLDSALRLGQSKVIGGVEIASRATINTQKPGTFRTNIGMVETSGQSVTVRLTVFYADSRAKAFGPITTFTFDLGPRASTLITNLFVLLEGFSRGGDLRNAQLQFDVIAGQGAVVIYTSSIDNGTGDSVIRLE